MLVTSHEIGDSDIEGEVVIQGQPLVGILRHLRHRSELDNHGNTPFHSLIWYHLLLTAATHTLLSAGFTVNVP
jgi:hypothetical protein